MSKKHKKNLAQIGQSHVQAPSSSGVSHAAEYRIIKFDLVRVVILNVIYLAVILSLYYYNRQSGFLDNWFAKVLHF